MQHRARDSQHFASDIAAEMVCGEASSRIQLDSDRCANTNGTIVDDVDECYLFVYIVRRRRHLKWSGVRCAPVFGIGNQ